jgi:hypothetical protein
VLPLIAVPPTARIAAPMIGSMVVLTLIVIPAIYALVKQFSLGRRGKSPAAVPAAAPAE